jgi:hypothetical protein
MLASSVATPIRGIPTALVMVRMHVTACTHDDMANVGSAVSIL